MSEVFEYAEFVSRNPEYALKNWRAQYAVRKAILKHKEQFPYCAWCGREDKLQVHHIIPVLVAPELAANPDNLITLCRPDHLYVAHNGNYGGRFKEDIVEACEANRVIYILKEDEDAPETS